MAKSNLYTRGGDAGTTSLVGGARIAKNSVRLEAYGTVDEFGSFLGAILSDPGCPEENRKQLLSVQNMLFNFGGYLATPVEPGTEPKTWGLTQDHVDAIEKWVDALDEATPKVRAFVLPGGTPLSAKAHIARSVCRRTERRLLDLAQQEYVDPTLLRYINRMSDYLFILARYFNHIAGVEEIKWSKD